MPYLIMWIICGFIGLGISATKKAGGTGVTVGDVIWAMVLGPLLMFIALIMPHEATYDEQKRTRISNGEQDAFDQDHVRVLQHLSKYGEYNPEVHPPIVWDKYRTKRVLTDLMSLPQPLLNCAEGVYSLSVHGAETCRMAAFIEHLKQGGDPAQFRPTL